MPWITAGDSVPSRCCAWVFELQPLALNAIVVLVCPCDNMPNPLRGVILLGQHSVGPDDVSCPSPGYPSGARVSSSWMTFVGQINLIAYAKILADGGEFNSLDQKFGSYIYSASKAFLRHRSVPPQVYTSIELTVSPSCPLIFNADVCFGTHRFSFSLGKRGDMEAVDFNVIWDVKTVSGSCIIYVCVIRILSLCTGLHRWSRLQRVKVHMCYYYEHWYIRSYTPLNPHTILMSFPKSVNENVKIQEISRFVFMFSCTEYWKVQWTE